MLYTLASGESRCMFSSKIRYDTVLSGGTPSKREYRIAPIEQMSQCSVIFWELVAKSSFTSALYQSIFPLCKLAISWSSRPIFACSGEMYSVLRVRISNLIVVSYMLGKSILSTCLWFQQQWYKFKKHIQSTDPSLRKISSGHKLV